MILNIHTSKSAEETTHYFIGQKSLESYYSRDGQEFAGNWIGKGAELLGLKGHVTDEAFARLAHNLHPLTGEQLTPRMRGNRRPGFDLTFNVPKSVSLTWAYTKDERIIRAFRQMVLQVVTEMQEEAATRVRVKGRDEDRKTGVLVAAEIIHLTARPQGSVPDPHVHEHLYVFNITWDAVEKRFKAQQMGLIKEHANTYRWRAAHLFSENLKALGLDIVPTRHGFEIAGIPRELNEKFSRRTKTIEEEVIKRGITDPAEKAKLAVLTRERKSKSLLISEIEPYWWANLLPEERKALEAVAARLQLSRARELGMELAGGRGNGAAKAAVELVATTMALGQKDAAWAAKRVKAARGDCRVSFNRATCPTLPVAREVKINDYDRRAVALAIEHVFERRSVVSEMQLEGEALSNFCVGRATAGGIRRVIAEAPLIRRERDGRMMVTTAEVLAEEKRIAQRCLDGKGRFEAINEFWKIRDEELTAEQQNGVSHVLNSRDFISGIAGNPGVGKTKMLREIKRGIDGGCYKVIALAPWGVTAHEVLRKDGFETAETVAKLLTSEKMQHEARGAVWLVDEAGLLSTREADRLIALAKELEARLVLVGDVGQHHAVERGQAFDHLQKSGGMSVAKVTQIQRQRGAYKFVVEAVLAGDIERAFRLLDRMEALHEMTLEQRKVALAKDYVAAIEKGETALVVAPTHAECKDVTEGIRAALKEKKRLKAGVQWDALPNLGWTDAQKSDCDQYERGMVAQINGHVQGFALGEQVEVIDVREGLVRVRSQGRMQDGIKALPLDMPDAFSVHKREKIELCEGELVRITANGRSEDRHRLCNGSRYAIDYISPEGELVLENGWRLGKDFKHLEYGYTLTSHASQGKTVDRVFVAQSPEMSSGASDLTQFLVSITRGSKGLGIYTTDIELLREDVSRVRKRLMATELLALESVVSDRLGRSEKAEAVEREPLWNEAVLAKEKAQLEAQAKKMMQEAIKREREREAEMAMEMGM